MELIVFRHALAEEREEFAKKGLEDNLRPLTLKGRKRMQKVCVELRDHIEHLDLIISSPLVRARQTAEIISQIYFETPIVEAPELAPQAPPSAFVKWLRTQTRDQKIIAIVGHEPHLSSFVSFMLSGKVDSFIDFKKSGVIGLDLESFASAQGGEAQLSFYVPPKFFMN